MENDTTTHELRLLDKLKLDSSPSNLAFARRRVFRAGRLSEFGAHMAEGVLAVEVVDHGGPDYMQEGHVFARVVLDASAADFGKAAAALQEGLEGVAASRGQLLMLAVYRATARDRRRAWLRWTLRGRKRVATLPA